MEIYSPRKAARTHVRNEMRGKEPLKQNDRPVNTEVPARSGRKPQGRVIMPEETDAAESPQISVFERMGNRFYEVLRSFFESERKTV